MSVVIYEAAVSRSDADVNADLRVFRELVAQLNVDAISLDAIYMAGRLIRHAVVLSNPCFCALFDELTEFFFSNSMDVLLIEMHADDCTKSNCNEIFAVMERWLNDVHHEVREATIVTLCIFAEANISSFPSELLSKVLDKFDNDELPSRFQIVYDLWGVYHAYCMEYSEGVVKIYDHYEKIAYRTLVYILEKTCCESFSLDRTIAKNLFPKSLSAESRAEHWAYFLPFFSSSQRQKLEDYLSDKHMFQQGVREFLELVVEKGSTENIQFCSNSSIKKFFLALCGVNDSYVYSFLQILLDKRSTVKSSNATQEAILSMIEPGDPSRGYLRNQILKCSYSIFTYEYVGHLIFLLNGDVQSAVDPDRALKLLSMIIKVFPDLREGYEEDIEKAFYSRPGD